MLCIRSLRMFSHPKYMGGSERYYLETSSPPENSTNRYRWPLKIEQDAAV